MAWPDAPILATNGRSAMLVCHRVDMSKPGLLAWNSSHDNEMYGITAAFLRIKGIVPPSSEGRP